MRVSLVLAGRRLWRAGGAEPPSAIGGSRAKSSPPAGGKQCVKDRYRMAGTPRGPVRLWLKNQQDRRIEPGPQGHARLLISVSFWLAQSGLQQKVECILP